MSPPLIKLGLHWSRFSRPRDDLQFLGTIQQGASIGALARRADGRYLQVNGDVEVELNSSRVEANLRVAQRASPAERPDRGAAPGHWRDKPKPPPPSVIVKRRRTFVLPTGDK